MLVALLIPLPWAYGAVHLPARGAYVVCVALLFAGTAIWRIREGGKPALLDGPTGLLLVAIAWAATALVPLPVELLRLVAPSSWNIAVGHFVEAGLDAPVEHPIAVAPRDAAAAWATAAAHVMVFVLASRFLSGRRGARMLAGTLAVSGALMAILAITQESLGASRIFFVALERDRFYGTFVNGNHAATFLAAASLCGLGLLLRERDAGKKLAWGLAGVISAIGAMYSLSRGGVLALVAGLAVFLAGAVAVQGSFRTRRGDDIGRFFTRNAVPLMLAVLAVFYLSWLGPKKIGRELSSLAALDLPKDYRARVWGDSIDAVRDWPITGSGGGTFAHVYPRYRSFPADVTTEMAESDWVQLAVENGLVGFALVAGFVGLLLGRFFGAFLKDPLRFSGAHLGLGAALVAIVGHAMVDFPLRIPAIGAFAAAIAGALAGAVHRRRYKARRTQIAAALAAKKRKPGPRPVLLAWVALPAATTAALGFSQAGAPPGPPQHRDAALAILRDRPADARAWIRLARLSDGDTAPLYAAAADLDRGDPAVQRAVALGLARSGEAARATAVLSAMAKMLAESGPQWKPRSSELALDLAGQLLWSDPDAAEKALASAEPGPRRSLVEADIAAARAVDPAGTRVAVDAYLGAAAAAAKANAGAVADLARLRATLLTVNATKTMPAPDARAWFDRLAASDDPGRVLADLGALVTSTALDAQRIWGGPPRLGLDRFDGGEPRLRAQAPIAPIGPRGHRVEGGAELLDVSYPSAAVLTDLWTAPLAFRTSEPRLALSARIRAPGRLGDQLCVKRAGAAAPVFGTPGEPDAQGWRRVVIRGFAADATKVAPVALEGWCFDTRGRSGPYLLDDVELFLDASP